MQRYIKEEITKTKNMTEAVLADKALLLEAEKIVNVIIQAYSKDKKVMFAGNGGSAADSQHLAAELVSRLCFDRPALAAVALTTDTSALTAISNDYSYENVFSRQIEALGNEGDVFIAISTSGNSANILKALKSAKDKNIITVGFSGKSGGEMLSLCDYILKAPTPETPKVQECHIMMGHIICALVEEKIFGKEYNNKHK